MFIVCDHKDLFINLFLLIQYAEAKLGIFQYNNLLYCGKEKIQSETEVIIY